MAALIERTKYRILEELLNSSNFNNSNLKVLVVDAVTLNLLNTSCKLPELRDKNFPLVELLYKRREPQKSKEAVYFLHPSDDSIERLIDDMATSSPMYKRCHVFFTTLPPALTLNMILDNPRLHGKLAAVKEVNLEYLITDSHSFVTDHPDALKHLFSEKYVEYGGIYSRCITEVAIRLTSLFSALHEVPEIYYSKPSRQEKHIRSGAPLQLAATLSSCLHRSAGDSGGSSPKQTTCDLLIVDRTVDIVSPIIHDWSYRSLVHELLPMTGNTFTYGSEGPTPGKSVARTALLDESDDIWVQLRDKALPDAFSLLSDLVDNMVNMKASTAKDGASLKELRTLIQNLPNYLSMKGLADHHVKIASLLSDRVRLEGLQEMGTLQQALIFGEKEANTKYLQSLLAEYQGVNSECKMRMLMLYGICKPGKFDPALWKQAAGLQQSDMDTIQKMNLLGADIRLSHHGMHNFVHSLEKKTKSKLEAIGLRPPFRHNDKGNTLFRFYPYIQDLGEDLAQGSLNLDAFEKFGASQSVGGSVSHVESGKKFVGKWGQASSAKQLKDQSGSPGDGKSERWANRRKLILFILGGMTHAEVRSAHFLSEHLNREVIIGSTSLDTSYTFLQNVREL